MSRPCQRARVSSTAAAVADHIPHSPVYTRPAGPAAGHNNHYNQPAGRRIRCSPHTRLAAGRTHTPDCTGRSCIPADTRPARTLPGCYIPGRNPADRSPVDHIPPGRAAARTRQGPAGVTGARHVRRGRDECGAAAQLCESNSRLACARGWWDWAGPYLLRGWCLLGRGSLLGGWRVGLLGLGLFHRGLRTTLGRPLRCLGRRPRRLACAGARLDPPAHRRRLR